MDYVDRNNILEPDRPALLTDTEAVSNRRLYELVSRAGGAIEGLSVKPGDRVAVWADSTLPSVVALLAVSRQGAVAVPLNTRLTSAEARVQVDLVSPTLVVGADSAPALGRHIVHPESLWNGRPAAPRPHAPTDLHSIFFTAGSSGSPKGVPLSWANVEASAAAVTERLELGPDDIWLDVLPLFHVGGFMILYRMLRVGGAVRLRTGFDAGEAASDFAEVTLVSLVPTTLRALVEAGTGPGSVRVVLVGGSGTDTELLAAASAAGLPIAPTYGMTEASSQIATALPGDSRITAGSSGKLLSGVEVQLTDPEGIDAFYEEGEIRVRGPMVFGGYLGEGPPAGGWHRTGDLGRLDADGYLYVTGRLSDLIITGGENVRPAEVEAALVSHPGVGEAVVVGVADEEWGETVAAAYSGSASVDQLEEHARGRLAGFKVPRRWLALEELPRLPTGKYDREKISSLLAAPMPES